MPDDVILGNIQRDYKSETDLRIQCGEWLAKAYKETIRQQTAMTNKNKACRDKRFRRAHFKPGDFVLYWQPGNAQEIARKASKDDTATTKAKWTSQWSGPHVVTRKSRDNHYYFTHCTSAKEIKAHVNRLCIFNAWSEELPSTSPDLDSGVPWRKGGTAEVGSLFAIPYANGRCPFGIARLTGTAADGTLNFRWLSNSTDNYKGTFQDGWITADGAVYYTDGRKRSRNHVAYTGESSGTTARQEDIILHGFELTDNLKLPVPVIRAIQDALAARQLQDDT